MYLLYFLRDMFQLLLSPLKGWEDVDNDGFDAHRLFTKGLLPFLAITSVSVWLQLIYPHDGSAVVALEQMIVCFVKFFATYYLALFFFTLYLPTLTEMEFSMQKCTTFIIYGVGIVALINLVQNCMPVDVPLLLVLPVYAVYVLWRALRYLTISFGGVIKFILLIIFTLVAPPYILQYLFNFIVPSV